jgi:hypothetical protein
VKVRILTTAALAAAAALALAGCGSSAASGGSAGQAPSASGSSAARSGSTQPAATTASTNVCTDLTAARATQLTGVRFTRAKPSSVEHIIFACEYDGPDSALLQVSVQTEDGKDGFDTDVSALKTVGHAPDSVSGVGDEAFSAPDPKGNAGSIGASAFASYGAVFGDLYIKIGGLTYVTPGQGKQIVEQLHGKI